MPKLRGAAHTSDSGARRPGLRRRVVPVPEGDKYADMSRLKVVKNRLMPINRLGCPCFCFRVSHCLNHRAEFLVVCVNLPVEY
jgi:hypothetical protein